MAEAVVGTPPKVILGMSVVEDASGKRRLIIDARYTNVFLQYLRTYFQTVWTFVNQAQWPGFGHVFDF